MELDTAKTTEPGISLNQSAINMMQRCPQQYFRRYIQHETIPPSGTLHRGTAVHVASAHNFEQKITSHEDLPKKDIVEVAVETLKARVKTEGLHLTAEEKKVGKKTIVNEAEKGARLLTELYADKVAPLHQPTAVEQRHSFLLDSGVMMHGTLDVETDKAIIPDLKTASKSPSFGDYDKAIQPTMYSLLYQLIHGVKPAAVVIEALVLKKEPEHVRIVLQKQSEDFEAMLNQVDATARQIKSGIFPGAYGQQGAWWCSEKFCGYWSTCPFVPAHKR